jgi:hypothetical protein
MKINAVNCWSIRVVFAKAGLVIDLQNMLVKEGEIRALARMTVPMRRLI